MQLFFFIPDGHCRNTFNAHVLPEVEAFISAINDINTKQIIKGVTLGKL